jgi:hypothetical protein
MPFGIAPAEIIDRSHLGHGDAFGRASSLNFSLSPDLPLSHVERLAVSSIKQAERHQAASAKSVVSLLVV